MAKQGNNSHIVFIGAGRVGSAFSRLIADRGAEANLILAGFFSKSQESARRAVQFSGGAVYDDAISAVDAADIVFITTPDTQIASVWEELASATQKGHLNLAEKLICHCSGALSTEVFAGAQSFGAHVASVHPLYAVSSKDVWEELAHAWFCVEGDEIGAPEMADRMRAMGIHVETIEPSQKVRYHAAAVMASNLVVGLYSRAAAELVQAGFSANAAEEALAPLFLGNAQHIAHVGCAEALTGPAARGDQATIDKHLTCLEGNDRAIYKLLTEECKAIAARAKRGV